MASNTGQTLVAILAGAAIGAGLGILYAPDRGEATREKISKQAKKKQKELKKSFYETKGTLTDKAQKAKYSFEQKFNETLSSASYKADDIIVAMEEKLEALRKQNAKLQIDATIDNAAATIKKATS